MDNSFLLNWLAGTLLPLGALWLLYRLVLRGERCYSYNRALLLLAPVVALVLPLLPRPSVASWLAPTQAQIVTMQIIARPTLAEPVVQAAGWQLSMWLLGVYLLGVAVLLGRLAYRYAHLRRATRPLPHEPRPGFVLAYTGGRLPTSSFGRTIFWDETAGLSPPEAAAVLAHELVHVRQGHSLDVLWLEIWRALLWVNPFAHLLLPALRLTHELLADWEAMLQMASPADALAPAPPYPSLLARLAVRRMAAPGYLSLLQSFTFPSTLTRIAMLQNQFPVRRWKQWLALPVLSGLFLMTACQQQREVAPVTAREQASTAKTREESVQAIKENMLRILQEKIAPLEQQRRSGQPLSRAQQLAYEYIKQQIKSTEGMAATSAPFTPYEKGKAPVLIPAGVYTYVEQMPALPAGGGMGAIVKQIQENLVYPAGAHQEGKIFVSFIVQADGSVGDTKVLKSLSLAYDEAVVAAIRKLPRFVPGTQGGQPVAVSFTVPITFKIQP